MSRARAAVPILARRRRIAALRTLAECWHALSVEVRNIALQYAARELRDHLESEPAANISLAGVQLVGDLGNGELAPRLIPAVLSSNSELAQAGVDALARLRGGRTQLHSSLATLAATFTEHRRREVLRLIIDHLGPADLAFGSVGDPLAAWFMDAAQPAHMALRAELKKAAGPEARARAFEWLRFPAVAAAALERVRRPCNVGEHEAVLARAHLAVNPARRRQLESIRPARHRPIGWLPEPEAAAKLSERGRLGYARLVPRIHDEAERHTRLATFVADPSPRVQLAAARDAPLELGDESAVHPAARDLIRARRLALKPIPHLNLAELRRDLLSTDSATQAAAIRHIRSRRLAHPCEIELLTAAAALARDPRRDSDIRLAGIAAALARVPTDAARAALRSLLQHPDDRVRANALESLQSLDAAADVLIELKLDPAHRVRGSAVRAMLGDPATSEAGLGELNRLLDDDRPLHRLTGLWVVERFCMMNTPAAAPLASRIATMAERDPEAVVRDRARLAGRLLLAALRHAWARQAAPIAVSYSRALAPAAKPGDSPAHG